VPLSHNIPGNVKVPSLKSPVGSDPQAVQRGMTYFNKFNCVGCHAANGGGGMGPALSNSFFKYGVDPAQMFNVIAHGAPFGMPAWGTVLPESVIWDIVAYIQSISKAPKGTWGTTVNAAEHLPAIEQVPAEFQSTATPWNHTKPFSSGQKPTNHNPTTSQEDQQPPKAD
jgi:cytochrome c oxidase cbb3-type subunit 3